MNIKTISPNIPVPGATPSTHVKNSGGLGAHKVQALKLDEIIDQAVKKEMTAENKFHRQRSAVKVAALVLLAIGAVCTLLSIAIFPLIFIGLPSLALSGVAFYAIWAKKGSFIATKMDKNRSQLKDFINQHFKGCQLTPKMTVRIYKHMTGQSLGKNSDEAKKAAELQRLQASAHRYSHVKNFFNNLTAMFKAA